MSGVRIFMAGVLTGFGIGGACGMYIVGKINGKEVAYA